MAKLKEHLISKTDEAIVNEILPTIAGPLAAIQGTFMGHCRSRGLEPKIAAQLFSAYICTNLARTMALASGVPPHDIDMQAMTDAAVEASRNMAISVSDFILRENAKLDEQN